MSVVTAFVILLAGMKLSDSTRKEAVVFLGGGSKEQKEEEQRARKREAKTHEEADALQSRRGVGEERIKKYMRGSFACSSPSAHVRVWECVICFCLSPGQRPGNQDHYHVAWNMDREPQLSSSSVVGMICVAARGPCLALKTWARGMVETKRGKPRPVQTSPCCPC